MIVVARPDSFRNRDVVSVKDISREELELVFDHAREIKKEPSKFRDRLSDKIVSIIFFEPSTRTFNSFDTAAKILGCRTVGFADPSASSYTGKGETLHDTIKMFEGYSDCIVIRHPMMGAAKFASEVSGKPVINAGSGAQEHPTQALLDIFTMRESFGKMDSLNIGMLGDLRYSRTIPSLVYALSKYDVRLNFISPESLQPRPEVESFLKSNGVKYEKSNDIKDSIKDLDVLYVTRLQKERFVDPTEYQKLKGSYQICKDSMVGAKDCMIILHPLPRVDEISAEVDSTKHAMYFEQARNGLYVRMALLDMVMGK